MKKIFCGFFLKDLMAKSEGVIKFQCLWTPGPAKDWPQSPALLAWRQRLKQLGLVGAYPDGIGYGNLSVRLGSSQEFIITGSQTGHLESLTSDHIAWVKQYDILQNQVWCQGPIKASSESMSHAAVYASRPEITAVMHVHHRLLWQWGLQHLAQTNPSAEFGTPQMALEISRLLTGPYGSVPKIVVMAGHEEGIISVGEKLESAGQVLLQSLENATN
jgi:L-ribulose-5-phosphate 4-epimerase